MSPAEAVLIILAGMGAGAINTVVGSGTLITFPVLIGLGYPPLIANVSNNTGLVPGALSGIYGYRRELAGQGARTLRLLAFATGGSCVGAVLLLSLPSSAFEMIVPPLIISSVILVLAQPRLSAWLASRRPEREGHQLWLRLGVFGAGIYGGYFGAAQGVIFIAILGLSFSESLQRLNAVKNVLSFFVNFAAGVIFIFVADLDWAVAGLIAVGAILGAFLGAHYGRRLPDYALRVLIACVGGIAALKIILGW